MGVFHLQKAQIVRGSTIVCIARFRNLETTTVHCWVGGEIGLEKRPEQSEHAAGAGTAFVA